jgi:hypothetical protein
VNDDDARQVRRRLDEVVGTRFDPEAPKGLFVRIRRGAVKALVAAVLAISAAALVIYTIESHRLPSPEKVNAAKSGGTVDVFIPPPPAKK